jgi:phenylacetic acid degradation operon negative regulatory protein
MCRRVPVTAKRAILELLSVIDPQPAPASALIDACELFDVSENSVRVTLARLSAQARIEATGRGVYRLHASTRALARASAEWRALERKLRPWDGAWVFVYTGALGRSERSELRTRERAMQLVGLQELVRGVALRPDNLAGGGQAVRERLLALGVEEEAIVTHGQLTNPDDDAHARTLWPGATLSAGYRKSTERLRRWLRRHADSKDARAIARETFMIGSEVLHQLVFDPLLPEPLVDVAARRTLVETMLEFDAVGRRAWQAVFGQHGVEIIVG